MNVLNRKKQYELSGETLRALMNICSSVHIDIGTGSGKYVILNAARHTDRLYIGIDPCADAMAANAARLAKNKSSNALYVVSSIENPPPELNGIADYITVILPWGSLRDGIVKAERRVIGNLRGLGKIGSRLSVLTGYEQETERHELAKRNLPPLSKEYFESLSDEYGTAGITIQSVQTVDNRALKQIDTDWAKRLGFGTPRTMYRIDCIFT